MFSTLTGVTLLYVFLNECNGATTGGHRGRTASHPTAPAQIPACGFPALGSLGLLVIARGYTGLIGRTDRVDKSLFRLGLDWLRHVLKRGLPLNVHLLFQPPQSLVVNVR